MSGGTWLSAWGASPQEATIQTPVALKGFHDVTLREIVFSSAAGAFVRVRFTAAAGHSPLEIGSASIALAGPGASLEAATVRPLTFSGRPSAQVRPGSTLLSDPVQLAVPALARLAISMYLPDPTGPVTQHVMSHETNFAASGNHALDPAAAGFADQSGNWDFLDNVETYSPARYGGAVVTLGDSITAGVGSLRDANATWPDDLARRLNAVPGPTLSVVDEGIGGNRILSGSPCCGASAIARFSGDVSSQAGVREVILLEGVNDIGFSAHSGVDTLTLPHTNVSAQQIIAGDEQLIADAHARGLRIFGATILPFRGARYWTPAGEAKREAVNHWILTSGAFDGTIDFASAVADPANPLRLNPAYDSGDHLHPNDAGYQTMANAIPLGMLLSAAG